MSMLLIDFLILNASLTFPNDDCDQDGISYQLLINEKFI